MRTVWRWGVLYLLGLVGFTALGHYNQQLSANLAALQEKEAELQQKETRLLLQRYQLTSPLALRAWAEESGYIPMSLGRWIEERSIP